MPTPLCRLPDLAASLKLTASELASNAIAHSASGEEGAFFVAVLHFPHHGVGLRVCDMGPRGDRTSAPQEPPAALDALDLLGAEHGRGLALVALQSCRYGWTAPPEDRLTSVWAELPAALRGNAA
ncbi:ATP-binding protein [Allosalinactinospora lopnorensis]|uniref:ATP-binding protein n=1 Tax=Allosalinactinospora lopnorensis TaxID=1352348 RepID=UPI000623DEF4|nr:ATP-binding protein [Allosalinactinospora lopnorensis]